MRDKECQYLIRHENLSMGGFPGLLKGLPPGPWPGEKPDREPDCLVPHQLISYHLDQDPEYQDNGSQKEEELSGGQ